MNVRKQRGMTLIGWVIVLAIIGVFATAALKILPIYLENYKISSVLAGLKSEFSGKDASREDIRGYLSRRFDVESIRAIKTKDVEIKAQGDSFRVRVNYDSRTTFIGNLDFIVTMDKAVEVPR